MRGRVDKAVRGPVSDDAAQRLMSRFYRLLAEGHHGKIAALRAAQLELIGRPSS